MSYHLNGVGLPGVRGIGRIIPNILLLYARYGRESAVILAVFFSYFVTATLGLSFDAVSGFAALIWPPTGIALTAVAILGYRVWPIIFLGALSANITVGAPFLIASTIGIGNSLEALAGVYLFRRLYGSDIAFNSLKAVFIFIAYSAFFSAAISATIGVSSLWLGGSVPAGDFFATWRAWLTGDVLGTLIVGPLLLSWFRLSSDTFPGWKSWRFFETVGLAVFLLSVGFSVFFNKLSPHHSLVYLSLMPLIWAALRFREIETATAMFATSLLAIVSTIQGTSPFTADQLSHSLLLLQTFMGVVSITILILGAAAREKEVAEEKIRMLNEKLITAQTIAQIGSWEWSFSDNRMILSKNVSKIYGFTVEDMPMTFEGFLGLVYAEDRETVRCLIEDAIQSRGSFDFYCRFIRPENVMRTLRGMGNIILDHRGIPTGVVGVTQDVTSQKEAEETIRFQAYHDVLTGLLNRKAIEEQFIIARDEAKKTGAGLAVLFLDLDRFKTINDTVGHYIGDIVLKEIVSRINRLLRSKDVAARLGGDEFLILLEGISSSEEAGAFAQKILDACRKPVEVESHRLRLSTSIGIALFPQDGQDMHALLKSGDIALYRAKENGRNRYHFFNSRMNSDFSSKLDLENDLWNAYEQKEMSNYYQPIVNAAGALVGFETLVRWKHPRLGLLHPQKFIPIAEETGFIVSMGRRVLLEACREHHMLVQRLGCRQYMLCLNISSRQFTEGDLAEIIKDALARSNFDPRYLEIEITESVAMESGDRAEKSLKALKDIGISISIDDFGTGYSSLNYLRRFPVDKLKIDKSFVQGCSFDGPDASIVRSIIAIGHNLGLKVVAEGVETKEQFKFLKSCGCDEFQGYLVSRALPLHRLESWLYAYAGRTGNKEFFKRNLFAAGKR